MLRSMTFFLLFDIIAYLLDFIYRRLMTCGCVRANAEEKTGLLSGVTILCDWTFRKQVNAIILCGRVFVHSLWASVAKHVISGISGNVQWVERFRGGRPQRHCFDRQLAVRPPFCHGNWISFHSIWNSDNLFRCRIDGIGSAIIITYILLSGVLSSLVRYLSSWIASPVSTRSLHDYSPRCSRNLCMHRNRS